MATIKISDSLGAELISANPQVNSGLGKYLKGLPAQILAGSDFVGQFRQKLQLVNPGLRGFGLTFSKDFPLGDAGPTLSVTAGNKAEIGVYNRTGMLLFDDTYIGDDPEVVGGQAFVSFAFHPNIGIGVSAGAGNLSFGFNAGTDVEFRCCRPFDLMGPDMTLGEACKDALENFMIPAKFDDLKNMRSQPDGTISSVSGHGDLSVSCSVDLTAAFNPLASVNTIAQLGKLTVGATASVTAGFQAKITGEWQIRVQKMTGDILQLSYHKMAARELQISLEGEAGSTLTLGDRDVLSMIFSGPGGLSGASETDLVAAGISKVQLDQIRAAAKAGMSKRIELDIAAQFSSMTQKDAAFLYEIDLSKVDATAESALSKALACDLTEINAIEDDAAASHGIRCLQTRFEKMRKKKLSWRINLVGIVNVLSMTQLVRDGTVFTDNDSGELVIADKVTSQRVGAVTESSNLRKLLYESAMMTATYKASGLDVNAGLTASQSYFFFDQHANRHRMSDYLDAVAAVGLMHPEDVASKLGAGDDFGKASLLLESEYDQAMCEAMFLDTGRAHDLAFFEDAAKRALLRLIQPADPDAYRRIPLLNVDLWQQMKDTGQPGFREILRPPITGGADELLRVSVVQGDYTLIVWWSEAMAKAAAELEVMRKFLANRDPVALDADPAFKTRRSNLEKEIAGAIAKNKSRFDDPWGLVAMFLAASAKASVNATVVSSKLTLFLP